MSEYETTPVLIGEGNDLERPAPRENEEELWDWLDNLANEAERVRNDEAQFDQFDKRLDMYYGKHWPDTMPTFRPPVVINELRTLILSEASDLAENAFRPYVMRDPQRGGRDEQTERALRAVWAREQVDLKLTYAAVWALILGTGFLRVQWDPDSNRGMGDVTVEDLDPRYVLPDPDALSDKKMAYIIIEAFLDIAEVRRMFPITGHRVRPDDRYSIRTKRTVDPESISWSKYLGPLSDRNSLLGGRIEGYKKARARVLDCLVKDDSVDQTIEEETDSTGTVRRDENGNATLRTVIKARYPNGRRIIGANGVILFDGDNPNPGGDFGIVRVLLEPALGRFWGQGFVHQTADLQLAADKLMSSVVENAIRLNNGILVTNTNSGVDWESFAGIPGQIVQLNVGATLDIKYPPPMPPDMVQAPWRMLDMQRRILGFPESRSGSSGRGNVSAELTETEISQAMGPTRLRGRMLYYTVQRLAEMIFARMASGYMTERMIPAVEGEQFKPVTWQPLMQPERYGIYVDPSSFQVMSKTMLKRLGLALFKLRAIDRNSLLETIGWPNWEDISKRMNEADRQASIMDYYKKKK